jgi:DHA2 family multidrug resistance protein
MPATFMEILDTMVVNVSLPHMAGNPGATVEEGMGVVTSFRLQRHHPPHVRMAGQPHGRCNVLLACVTGFTFSSVLCGMATSLDWLIFVRVPKGSPAEDYSPRPSSAPRWAAGSPTTIPGVGSLSQSSGWRDLGADDQRLGA